LAKQQAETTRLSANTIYTDANSALLRNISAATGEQHSFAERFFVTPDILPSDFWETLQTHHAAQTGGVKEIMKSREYPGILAKVIRVRGFGEHRLWQQEQQQFSCEISNFDEVRRGLTPQFLPLSLFTIATIHGEERHVILQEYLHGQQFKRVAQQCGSDIDQIKAELYQNLGHAPATLPTLLQQLRALERTHQREGELIQTHLTDCDWIMTPDQIKLIDSGPLQESVVTPRQRRIVTALDQLAAAFGLVKEMSVYLRV
jgi:hypothetical protein